MFLQSEAAQQAEARSFKIVYAGRKFVQVEPRNLFSPLLSMNRESSYMTGLHVINVRPLRPGLRVFAHFLSPHWTVRGGIVGCDRLVV